MHRHITRRPLMVAIVALAIATTVSVDTDAQALGSVYVQVMDQTGQPVTDLTPEEFNIQEDEQTCTVVAAQPGTMPMKVALLVDNGNAIADANALNPLRDALDAFLDTLPAQHAVGLFTIARNMQRRVDFTTDRAVLKESVGTIFADRGAGAVMLDGIKETWERRFEDNDAWPVFVMVLTDGTESSGNMNENEYGELVGSLMMRGATVHSVLLSTRGGNVQTEYSINLTQNTGGRYRTIAVATGLPDTLTTLATEIGTHFDDMSSRWRVVYECPDPPGDRISVGVNRPGVGVRVFGHRRMEP